MSDIQPYKEQFQKIVSIIELVKEKTYYNIGEYISKESENAKYGDGFVQKLAESSEEN